MQPFELLSRLCSARFPVRHAATIRQDGRSRRRRPSRRVRCRKSRRRARPRRKPSENLAKKLYQSLSPDQRQKICFPWDYSDERGLLRMHVANNWQITREKVASTFLHQAISRR